MLHNGNDHHAFARRINRSILAMNIALILTSLLGIYAVWRTEELSRLTIRNHARDLFLVQELRLELGRAVSVNRAFFVLGEAGMLDQYSQAEQAFYEHAQTLTTRIESPEGRRLLAAVINRKLEHSAIMARAMRLSASGSPDDLVQFFEDEVRPATQAIQTALAELLAHKTRRLEDAASAAVGVANTARWVLLALVLANLLFSLVMRWTTRSTLKALDQYAASLVEAVRARDEFLAIASHELRTPLAIVNLQTQLLKRRLASGDVTAGGPKFLKAFAAQVDRAVASLSTLVTRMLDTANISRGQLLLHKEKVDLSELTEEIVAHLEPAFSEAGSAVRLRSAEPVVGHWDRARLDEVVTNLLMNVVRHAPGVPANVAVTAEAGKARLVVEDAGPGIASEDHARMFERFERAHLSAEGGGMGLGLAVSREIVRAHGGDLWVESEAGKGARFVLELPTAAEG